MGGEGLYRMLGVDWWVGEKDGCLSVGVLRWVLAMEGWRWEDGGDKKSSS